MKGDKVFLDTNILVYAYDISAGRKHNHAEKIVADLWNARTGVLSIQVLQEFFVSVTKKIPHPLDSSAARDIVKDFIQWEIVVNDGELTLEAIEIQTKQRFSFWDAMIIAAALRSDASTLLTEDLSDGRLIEGLRIENPFKELEL